MKKIYIVFLAISFHLIAMEDLDDWVKVSNKTDFAEMSQQDKEVTIFGSLALTNFTGFKKFLSEVPTLQFSQEMQPNLLRILIDEYVDLETFQEVLDTLIKHGISLNVKYDDDFYILHYALYNALKTGEVEKLEAFLKRGADATISGKNSPYQAACNKISEPHGLKVLTSFIRYSNVLVPPSFENSETYKNYVNKLEALEKNRVFGSFLQVLDSSFFSLVNNKTLEVLAYKKFFETNKLSLTAQKLALNILVKRYQNQDLSCFFLTLAINYGLDLNSIMNNENITGFEYLTKYALATGETALFKEALKNGVAICDSKNKLFKFLEFEKLTIPHAKQLATIFNEHRIKNICYS